MALDKKTALLQIARVGYDVGFGSKKHFASFDLIEKAPGWLGLISLAGGLWALFVPALENKHIAATFILFSFVTFYINQYAHEKDRYRDAGVRLIRIYHELGALYAQASALPDASDFQAHFDRANQLRDEAIQAGLTKQLFASDWYAHFKFFGQTQHDWVDEQLHFRFWRDMVPAGLYGVAASALVFALAAFALRYLA
jgi:hypothetical protein